MEKFTPVIQSNQNTNMDVPQVLAHFAIVSFAVFGLVLNLFSQLWDSGKQLGSVPGRLVAWLKQKISDMDFSSIWQQRESNS